MLKTKKFIKTFLRVVTLTVAVAIISAATHFDDGIVVSARSVLPSGYAAYYTDDRLMQMLKAAENSIIPRDALIDALNLTYPDGKSYYSIKKDSGCECHTVPNSCEPDYSCDCKVYAGSVQCMAFAKYCHSIYNGTDEIDLNSIKGDRNYVILNKNNLYNYLSEVGAKSYLRNSSHSVFIVSFTKTTVEFYDANYGGKCIVHHQTVSYTEFVKRFATLDFAYTAEPDKDGNHIIDF